MLCQKLGFLLPKPLTFGAHHKNKWPGVIGWNLIKLAYVVFVQKYGVLTLENFDCFNQGESTVVFTALCFPSLQSRWISIKHVLPLTPMDSSNYLKRAQKFTINEDGLLGKVLIGNANKSICVPGNCILTILGRLGKNTKVPSGTSCLIDTPAVNNFLTPSRKLQSNN